MRHVVALMAFVPVALVSWVLSAGSAFAEECVIEDFRYSYTEFMKALTLEGVTSCATGVMHIRLYDGQGETRQFVGVETVYIEGYIFETIVMPTENPTDLAVKYVITPE